MFANFRILNILWFRNLTQSSTLFDQSQNFPSDTQYVQNFETLDYKSLLEQHFQVQLTLGPKYCRILEKTFEFSKLQYCIWIVFPPKIQVPVLKWSGWSPSPVWSSLPLFSCSETEVNVTSSQCAGGCVWSRRGDSWHYRCDSDGVVRAVRMSRLIQCVSPTQSCQLESQLNSQHASWQSAWGVWQDPGNLSPLCPRRPDSALVSCSFMKVSLVMTIAPSSAAGNYYYGEYARESENIFDVNNSGKVRGLDWENERIP